MVETNHECAHQFLVAKNENGKKVLQYICFSLVFTRGEARVGLEGRDHIFDIAFTQFLQVRRFFLEINFCES